MSAAQVLFAIALGTIALVITIAGLYIASSPMWGDRWYPRRTPDDRDDPVSR